MSKIMIFTRVKIGHLLNMWHGQILNWLSYIFLMKCYIPIKNYENFIISWENI